MKKFFIGINILLITFIGFLVFSPNDYLTGYVVLEKGLDNVIIGSVLYYNLTDLDTGQVLEKDIIRNQTIFMVRPKYIEEIKDDDKIKELDSWIITKDADNEGDLCTIRDYENKKYYYDENKNNKKDEEEFELYSTYVDENGCFNIKLPDELFVIIGLQSS